MSGISREKQAERVTIVGLIGNALLVAAKYAAGIVASSGAMIADATHSLSDTVTDFAVIAGLRMTDMPPDEDHEYGHGRIETLVAAFCGVMLAAAAIGILSSAVWSLYEVIVLGEEIDPPGVAALYAAIVSIVVKEILYRYTAAAGRKLESPALIANAWHHRSDALSSIGTALGIGAAATLGGRWAVVDPVAALAVGVMIFLASWQILSSSCQELIDRSLGQEGEQVIKQVMASIPGVLGFHNVRSRRLGAYISIDAHIFVESTLSIVEAHDIASAVEKKLRTEFGPKTQISIHVEPYDDRREKKNEMKEVGA